MKKEELKAANLEEEENCWIAWMSDVNHKKHVKSTKSGLFASEKRNPLCW